MPRNTTVVAVCGCLAEDSVTRVALREVLTAAIGAADAPELRRRLRKADAVVLGTSMCRETIGSPLETALDCSGVDESLADRVQRLGTELVRHEDVAQCPEAASVTAPHPHAD